MTYSTQLGMTAPDSTRSYPTRPRPPDGAPNVVVIVFDDLGFGQLGCFGSDIRTPTVDRLGGVPSPVENR